MKRYQVLIQEQADQIGLRPLARALKMPAQSLSNYLIDGAEPRTANLEKMSALFGESPAALMMEVGEKESVDNLILERLGKMGKARKKEVLKFMETLV